MSTTPNISTGTAAILDALGHLHDEADRWTLAETLLAHTPQNAGNKTFKQIVDDATAAGVPTLSVTSLRQYRDTAARWPADKRVKGASFTAHREVQTLGVEEGARLLADMVKNVGAAKVTTSAVRKAIAATQGTSVTAAKPVTSVSISDLMNGGAKLIAALKGASLDSSSLDKLHTGLSAVLVEVEAQRVKAARRQAGRKTGAAKPAAPKAKPAAAPAPAAPVVSEQVAVGDIRGL